MTLLYSLGDLFFFRIRYYEDNFIYQSRGFNNLKNLKISLRSFIKDSQTEDDTTINYIEVLNISPITNKLNPVCKGGITEIKLRLYKK